MSGSWLPAIHRATRRRAAGEIKEFFADLVSLMGNRAPPGLHAVAVEHHPIGAREQRLQTVQRANPARRVAIMQIGDDARDFRNHRRCPILHIFQSQSGSDFLFAQWFRFVDQPGRAADATARRLSAADIVCPPAFNGLRLRLAGSVALLAKGIHAAKTRHLKFLVVGGRNKERVVG